MYRRILLSVSCMVFILITKAQEQPSLLYQMVNAMPAVAKKHESTDLFIRLPLLPAQLNNTVLTKQGLYLNKNESLNIYQLHPEQLSVAIPGLDNTTYTLQLMQQDISHDSLAVYTLAKTGAPMKTGSVKAVHYRGFVKDYPSSIAAFTVFEDGEIMGMFSNGKGNFNLGKLNNGNDYILYNDADMRTKPGFECGTAMLPVINSNKTMQYSTPAAPQGGTPGMLCKKVRFMWEADFKLYNNNFSGNLTNTANYIAGLFNQVATMYANEGITIELNSTFIWTTPDPYNTSTSANALNTFKSRYNTSGDNFNADLCMLLDGAPTNNGGLAYILDFDQCNRSYAYGYANIYATYNTVPTYSWDVEVMTHEMGHLMGSYHTHWCGWNTGAGGSCGAIDDCFAVEAGTNCTTCSATTVTTPSAPAGFMGTVMSYCYLRNGIGVNLSNGFGPLPQARIRSCVNAAACFIPDNKWMGTVSTAWENAANWSCGSIPGSNTDVTISNGVTNYPVVNSAAVCRKLKQKVGSSVTVRTGFSLRMAGTGN